MYNHINLWYVYTCSKVTVLVDTISYSATCVKYAVLLSIHINALIIRICMISVHGRDKGGRKVAANMLNQSWRYSANDQQMCTTIAIN